MSSDVARASVNLNPHELRFLDARPELLRRAITRVADTNCSQAQTAAWRHGLSAYPINNSFADLAKWFDAQLLALESTGRGFDGAPTAAAILALELRREGVLLLNVGMFRSKSVPLLKYSRRTFVGNWPRGHFTEFEQQLLSAAGSNNTRSTFPAFFGSMSPMHGRDDLSVDAFLDLIRALVSTFPEKNSQESHILRRTIRDICSFLGVQNRASDADEIMRECGWGGNKTTFWRNREHDENAGQWISAFSEYLNCRRLKSASQLRDIFIAFLDWIAQAGVTDGPAEISRSIIVDPKLGLLEWLRTTYPASSSMPFRVSAEIYRFFEWYCDDRLALPSPMRKVDIWPAPGSHGKTTKALIPSHLLRMARQVCEELVAAAYDNAITLPPRMARRFGYLKVSSGNVATGEKVYSPVRSTLLLTLLMIPIRSIQARLLDSGEADDRVPIFENLSLGSPLNVRWAKNPSDLCQPGRRQGALRQIWDASAQLAGRPDEFVGFWINTNKTAAGNSGLAEDRGYEIPWQREDLIYYLAKLRLWQVEHNPLRRLLARDELSDPDLHPTPGLRGKLPRYGYLFRDKVDGISGDQEPPTYSQLRSLFGRVMAEVEDRLFEQGLRSGQGQRIQLVRADAYGAPSRIEYSLHGLRVAGISAFAEAGVPATVIAEFVAGHATVLMTLYYQKFGPATITRLLDQALAAESTGAHDCWLSGLPSSSVEPFDPSYAGSVDAQEQFGSGIRGLWSIKIDGACPNGQQRCHEGYKPEGGSIGPVPGGPANCSLCRFWVTGPTFLAGQVITLNSLLFAIRKRSETLVELHAQRRSGSRGYKITHAIESLENQLDLDVRSLNARHRLLEMSINLQEDSLGSTVEHQMLTQGSIEDLRAESALTEVTDVDFYDFLARAVEFFPEIQACDAGLRRNALIDQALDRDGFGAMLYKMSPSAALAAGNAFSRFLSEAYGAAALSGLVEGQLRLGKDLDVSAISTLTPPLRLQARNDERHD